MWWFTVPSQVYKDGFIVDSHFYIIKKKKKMLKLLIFYYYDVRINKGQFFLLTICFSYNITAITIKINLLQRSIFILNAPNANRFFNFFKSIQYWIFWFFFLIPQFKSITEIVGQSIHNSRILFVCFFKQ